MNLFFPESRIRDLLERKNVKIIAEDNVDIRGFGDKDTIYLTESLLYNPAALYHEYWESYYAANKDKLPKGINAHTFLRGVGKDVRRALDRIVVTKDMDADTLISALEAEMAELDIERQLTNDEKNLIKYNIARGRNGFKAVYGMQDRVFGREINEALTTQIKLIKQILAGQLPETEIERLRFLQEILRVEPLFPPGSELARKNDRNQE